jgi:hypothetical protein
MSDGGLIVLFFSLSLFGSTFVIWTGLRAVKRLVARWDGSSTASFVMTIGGFGQRQLDTWKRQARCDEDEAKIIIKYQLLCWFGMILWVLASMGAVMGYKALTYEAGHQAEHYLVDGI